MRLIDTKGQVCPAPLIATKRALKETSEGDSFRVETDNKVSLNNISRFLTDNHTGFSVEESGGVWTLTVTRGRSDLAKASPEGYCQPEHPHFSKADFVVAFTSDKMGEGDEDLGKILVSNFIKAVKDLDFLPSKIVFYNRGVMLGTKGSPVAEHLGDLEKMGVELLFCATCVNHYSLGNEIKIGTLSNIFEIARIMASSGNVVKP